MCEESVDCGLIAADDEAECKDDLHDALEAGDIDKQDVDQCVGCMRNNECGVDFLLDCSAECSAVSPYVLGSNIH